MIKLAIDSLDRLLLLAMLALISACAPPQTTPAPVESTLVDQPTQAAMPPAATSTTRALTATPTPTPIATATATAEAGPISTQTATRISSPTATVTATPSPTLPPPTATPTASLTPTPRASIPPIALNLIAAEFDQPVYVTHANDGSGRLFVVERHGKVRVMQAGQVQTESFLDIDPLVGSKSNEQGLLSLAFHPQFHQNRQLFVNYTDNDGHTVVARYETTPDSLAVDLATAQIILTIDQPFPNHNGGQLQFGPDGQLYIGTGDGGAANDPRENAQNGRLLLGKMLRINIDLGHPYVVSADNPFAISAEVRPEIWALGLRNPWRFSFDRLTGDLYIADVGQGEIEEINYEAAGGPGGLNYGWDIMEGLHCFTERNCDTAGLTLPIAEYSHAEGGCAVTGGYVYRGSAYPALNGLYLYGDFCSGKIWGLRVGDRPTLLLDSELSISSFGEDEAGEVYLVDLQGAIYQLVVP